VTVHDLFHLAMPRYAGRGLKRWAAERLLRSVRTRARAVLVPSEFTAGEFRKYLGEPRRLVVTPLAVDEDWSRRPEGDSSHPRPYFIFVGNVKPHKNLLGFLDAFALVKDRLPHDLMVVGKQDGFRLGDPQSALRAQALGTRVRFLGALGSAELRRWVAFAQAAVLPSFYEGFGLPPLEAMAMGTPVVVSDRASLPEVCGDAALYITPESPDSIAEALERLAGDPVLRQDLIDRGYERARTFSWEATLQKTLPALAEALHG
jgi:glycosyltransferase involved in cell wall biosynthesis